MFSWAEGSLEERGLIEEEVLSLQIIEAVTREPARLSQAMESQWTIWAKQDQPSREICGVHGLDIRKANSNFVRQFLARQK